MTYSLPRDLKQVPSTQIRADYGLAVWPILVGGFRINNETSTVQADPIPLIPLPAKRGRALPTFGPDSKCRGNFPLSNIKD